jgi:hypothetical protein
MGETPDSWEGWSAGLRIAGKGVAGTGVGVVLWYRVGRRDR